MECSRNQCNNKANTQENCRYCQVAYCSEDCKGLDWEELHRFICNTYLDFQLADLKEVNDPKLLILGKGSYGEVKLYQHITTKVLYAVKIINKEFIKKHSNINILLREISVHKSLQHPNIIQLVKHFEDSEKVYIVLEYAKNGSLFRVIRKEKGLSESRSWHYFTETCLGIKHLHDNEIIHRDLKPENILIDYYDHVKICDFGWCVKSTEVRTTFCGTLDYMAPEMLLNEGHSYPVDLWALGILLYELLHGYAPYNAKKDSEKRQQIIANEISFAPGVPTLAKSLILKLLKSSPKERLTMDKVLSHPWIAKFMQQHDISPGVMVKHPKFEIGEVLEVNAMICKVKFRDSIEFLTVPGTLPLIVIEKDEPRPTITVAEIQVFDDLHKWCLAPSRKRKNLRELHKETYEFNKNIEEFKGKLKKTGSIECFEEVIQRESVRKQAVDEKNAENCWERFGGVFETKEESNKIRENCKKNAKNKITACRGSEKTPKSKDFYTKDSTFFQKSFDIRNKLNISDEATDEKREELNKIRRTLEQSNLKKVKSKKESGGFWSNIFGCIDR